MAWAEQLPNGTWRACWRDQTGRRRSLAGHRNRATALRVGNEREAKNRRGEQTVEGRCPTWGEWCPTWVETRRVEPSTVSVSGYLIRKHLEPEWADRKLNRITRTEVQAWVNSLGKSGLAPSTVDRVFRLFQASMSAAVLADDLPVTVNPCSGVKLPTITPGHERFLTRGEVFAIAGHLNHPYKLAVLLAAGTGMRWGELAGLHWQRVDLGTGLVDIVETYDFTAGRIKPYPKGKLRRAVPLPAWLAQALGDAHDIRPDADACGQDHAPGGAACRSSLVVSGNLGAAINGKNFGKRQWAAACRDAGIDPPRLHDLRHTYASWLIQGDVQLQEVQRLLGHASSRTTERYSHLGTSQHARVLAVLS